MNKTVKTIGWILVALGLLGILADAGALVFGRQLMEQRQADVENLRPSADEGKLPAPGDYCIAEDKDGDGTPDGDCLQLPDRPEGSLPGRGNRWPRSGFLTRRGPAVRGRLTGFPGLPVFLFALGPIMLVVGAVMLLVNREPKPKIEESGEKKTAKKGKS